MVRTQVYLSDNELALLDRAERDTGATRSELIRRAVRSTFGQRSSEERLAALGRGVGIWKGRRTGAEYVDRARGDLNERLARLGLE